MGPHLLAGQRDQASRARAVINPLVHGLGGADPYQLLQVAPDAGRGEIVKAHRRQVRDLHPDRPTGDAERTTLLNLARDLLLDPAARADYDRHAASGQDAAGRNVAAEPAPPPSAWDTGDVQTGAAPPPRPYEPPGEPYEADDWYEDEEYYDAPDEPYRPAPVPYQPDPVPYQPYPPPFYPPQPPRGEPLGLPIAAVVCAFFCTPVGLLLGLVALRRTLHTGGTGRVLSIVAVAVSGAGLLCCFGLYGLSFIGSLADSTSP